MKNTESLQDLAKRVIDLGERASIEYVNRHKERTFSTSQNETISASNEIRNIIRKLNESQLNALKEVVKEEFAKCEQDSARYYGCTRVMGYIEKTLKPEETIWG